MERDNETLPVTKWYFDVKNLQKNQISDLNSNRVKGFLYESLYRSITRHNIKECHLLLKLLPKEPFLDPYILLRFIFILLECSPTSKVNKNVIFHLESLMSNFELSKPDAFLEFLGYFIRHNRLKDARELFSRRNRYINYKNHRSLPTIRTNLSCYEFLLNYLEWKEKVTCQGTKVVCDVSTQGWIASAMERLRIAQSNHEYFVICIVEVLLHYGFSKKAYLFVSEFQRNNPDNIGIQLLLNNLLNKLEMEYNSVKNSMDDNILVVQELNNQEKAENRIQELDKLTNFSSNLQEETFNPTLFPTKEDRLSIVKNLRRLDPSRKEIGELKEFNDDIVETFKDLMDGMEMVEEVRNISRWTSILELIDTLFVENDLVIIRRIRILWQTHYRIFWSRVPFLALAGDGLSKNEKELIIRVIAVLREKLDHRYTG